MSSLLISKILRRIGWNGLVEKVDETGLYSNHKVSPKDFRSWESIINEVCQNDNEKYYIKGCRDYIKFTNSINNDNQDSSEFDEIIERKRTKMIQIKKLMDIGVRVPFHVNMVNQEKEIDRALKIMLYSLEDFGN